MDAELKFPRLVLSLFIMAFVATCLGGCSGSSSGGGTIDNPLSKILSGISLAPSTISVNVSGAFDLSQIAVTATYLDNSTQTAELVGWEKKNGAGSVSGSTYLASNTPGRDVLTCSYLREGITKTADLSVAIIAPVVPDTLAPRVVLSDDHSDAIVRDADTVRITAVFSENGLIDETMSPRVNIGSIVSSATMTKVGNDNKTWQYIWNVPPGNDGSVAVTINARDSAGNACSAPTGKTTYTIDNTGPTVMISSSRENPTINLAPIPVTITFSEGVTGFTSGGVTVTNGFLSNFTLVSSSVYALEVTRAGNGHPRVDVPAGQAYDICLNLNSVAPQYTHQVSGVDGADVVIDEGGVSSVYVLVPRTTLPDGTVVPEFYCGKYPATGGAPNGAGAIYVNESTFQPDGNGTPRQAATTASGRPWVLIDWNSARIACAQAGGALISENQWLAIAHNALGVSANWRNGVIGSTEAAPGGFYRGLSNNTVSRAQPAAGGDVGANPDTTSFEHRVKTLTNGAQIWDIGGNVWQWVDQVQLGNTWYTGYTAVADWIETNEIGITTLKIKTPYDTTFGVGQIYNGTDPADRVFVRGGNWSYQNFSGAFTVVTLVDPFYMEEILGFRCTRP